MSSGPYARSHTITRHTITGVGNRIPRWPKRYGDIRRSVSYKAFLLGILYDQPFRDQVVPFSCSTTSPFLTAYCGSPSLENTLT